MITKEEKPTIPSIEDHHYYLFNEDFNPKSTGDLIKFIIERNLIIKILHSSISLQSSSGTQPATVHLDRDQCTHGP
jgi:hypothetical protein